MRESILSSNDCMRASPPRAEESTITRIALVCSAVKPGMLFGLDWFGDSFMLEEAAMLESKAHAGKARTRSKV